MQEKIESHLHIRVLVEKTFLIPETFLDDQVIA